MQIDGGEGRIREKTPSRLASRPRAKAGLRGLRTGLERAAKPLPPPLADRPLHRHGRE